MARIIPKNEYQNLKTRDAPMPTPRPQPHLLSLSFPSSFMIYDKAANPLGQLWTRMRWKAQNNCSRNTGGENLSASCVQCHIFIQNPISLILPCLR